MPQAKQKRVTAALYEALRPVGSVMLLEDLSSGATTQWNYNITHNTQIFKKVFFLIKNKKCKEVNKMNIRELERKNRIKEIINILKEIDSKDNVILNYEKFILEIMFKYGTSRRTAKEYIETAEYKLNLEKEDDRG